MRHRDREEGTEGGGREGGRKTNSETYREATYVAPVPLVVGVHSGGPIGGQYNHGACLMGSVYDHFSEWIEEGRKYLEAQNSA